MTNANLALTPQELKRRVIKAECEQDHLFFTRYFFKQRQSIKFIVNWHHVVVAAFVDSIIKGEIKNAVITVPPGSSKTEMVVINLIARGLAINHRCRFLHISAGDDLVLLNSQTARDIVQSEEYQNLWPLAIASDAKAKKRWNVVIDGKKAGGVYAVALGGQITGFRAGHMAPGFQGCIIIDDPLKADDIHSAAAVKAANRKLINTVKSRKAKPDVPVVLIMQRLGENDPAGFILGGNLPGKWEHLNIPALITDEYIASLPEYIREKIAGLVDNSEKDADGRFSYWSYKEPLKELLEMESGLGKDADGNMMSRYVFAAQYMQAPKAIGGNIIKGHWFPRVAMPPKILYRIIFADTAQKTAERNDYSVFECWGAGEDLKIYLLDLLRGKWEAPDLKRKANEFWNKHKSITGQGVLRIMKVEDKSSGTGLIQELKTADRIPIKGIERQKDKLTRVMDVVSFIESGYVCVLEDSPFLSDFISECEAFTADDTHAHDDQIDPMTDAIMDMLAHKPKGFFSN